MCLWIGCWMFLALIDGAMCGCCMLILVVFVILANHFRT